MQQMIATVMSVKTAKTAAVRVVRSGVHPLYHKTMTKKKNYLAHCEITVKEGDRVILVPCRPISKLKHWKVWKTLSS